MSRRPNDPTAGVVGTGNIAVLELQLSHTKPYIEEDA